MFWQKKTKSIRLRVRKDGLFILEDKVIETPLHPVRLHKFGTPYGDDGPELCKLMDSLKIGDEISIVYNPKILVEEKSVTP